MMSDENKGLVRRFVDEVFVRLNGDAVDELVGTTFVSHSWGPMEPGRASLKAAIARVGEGVSEIEMHIEDMVAEGDRVAVRLNARGLHTGELMGIPPSGRRYNINEMHIFRIADGLIAEHWATVDLLSLLRQLGALPDPEKREKAA